MDTTSILLCRTHRAATERREPGRWLRSEAPRGLTCQAPGCERAADAELRAVSRAGYRGRPPHWQLRLLALLADGREVTSREAATALAAAPASISTAFAALRRKGLVEVARAVKDTTGASRTYQWRLARPAAAAAPAAAQQEGAA